MDLQTWLSYLQTNSGTIKLGLKNIQTAANYLQLSKPAPYVITVAGTNGKGSVVRLLESLTTSLGFKTGCYTSPHLVNFNERICVNKLPLSDQEIITSFEYISKNLKLNILEVTFFEFITLAAWYIFQYQELDILILEIGLGGRLDAVNAIPKDLAIITSVDYDHQKFLGDTLEQIAKEKAGIIEVAKKVILGEQNMPEVINQIAYDRQADLYQYGVHFNLPDDFDYNPIANIKSNNIATGLKALEIVSNDYKFCYDSEIINKVLSTFNIVGRCSWVDNNQSILLDVAHNQQSIQNLANYLMEYKKTHDKKIVALCGMLSDKAIKECLEIINPVIDLWNFVSLEGDRGAKANNLSRKLIELSELNKVKIIENYSDITDCYKLVYNYIKQNSNKDYILVVFGSFHTVGPIYEYIQNLEDSNKKWKFS